MANKDEKRVDWRNLSLLVYGVATAVGYLYAVGYYGEFRIDILNYVEPLDLLLISLDNNDDILVVGLYCAIALPLAVVGAVVLGLAIVLVPLAIYLSAILACTSGILFLIAGVVATFRYIADHTYWAAKALRATFDGRNERENPSKSKGHASYFREKALRFVVSYKKTASASNSTTKEGAAREEEHDYLTFAKEVIEDVPTLWKTLGNWILTPAQSIGNGVKALWKGFFEPDPPRRLKGFTTLDWKHWLIVVSVLVYVGAGAYLNGKHDAKEIRLDAKSGVASTENADATVGDGRLGKANAAMSLPADNVDTESKDDDVSENTHTNGNSELSLNANIKGIWTGAWNFVCPIVPLVSCADKNDQARRTVTIYAVPTTNLSSLELKDCRESDRGKSKYARAILRHDVNEVMSGAMSDCLVYLGATGSMQFLADFGSTGDEPNGDQPVSERSEPVVVIINDDASQAAAPLKVDERSAVIFDARSGAVSTRMCELELVALVGPFGTGSADVDKSGGKSVSCSVPDQPKTEVLSVSAAVEELKEATFGTLVLVGRADIRPIKNEEFDSNMDLIQRRVAKVAKPLKDHRSLSVLRVPGGPMNWTEADHACSRVVEIYGCPEATGPNSTNGGSRNGAVSSPNGEDDS